MTPLDQQALLIAIKAHDGQYRKGNDEPYVTHPIAVAEILRSYGYKSDYVLAAAYLHDVIEDCDPCWEEEIKALSLTVYHYVRNLTNRESFLDTCLQLRHADKISKIIKCADIKHNTSDMGAFGNDRSAQKYLQKKLNQLSFFNDVFETRIFSDTVKQVREQINF